MRTLSKVTTATLALSGANTYSGATSILAGTLNLTANLGNASRSSDVLGISSSAASNLLLANGTTLSWSGSSAASTDRLFTINGSAAGHGATISANGTTTAAILTFTNTGSIAYGVADQTRTLTLRGTNTGDNTLAMAILDNGTGLVSLTKLDAGTWVLTGNSSYKGITLLSAGTLSISTSSNLGDASNTLTFDGGTLRVTGTSVANLDSRTVTYGTNKLVALNIADSSHTFTFSQALTQGSGGFTKSGAGRVDLTNAGNNYTGVTDIAGGTLRLRGAGLLSAGSALRLSGANAILDLNGTNQTVKGFSGTSSSTAKIVNNSGSGTSTITIGTGAANGTYAGQILDNDGVSTGGKVAVVHDAAGITTQFTPTGSNTYSGGTTVKQGTLQGNDVTAYSGATTTAAVNPFGPGKITLAGGALNLRIGAGDDTTAQTLSLGNDVEVTASSTLNYARQGGNTANKTLALGNLNLGAFTLTTVGANGYAVSFSSVTLTGNGTIGGNSQAPMTLGAIGESGGSYSLTFSKGFSNTPVVLTSASTYTGGTNLSGVAVTLQDKAAFGTGTVNLGSSGVATLLASKALTGADKIANNFTNTVGTLTIGGNNDMEFSGTWNVASNRTTSITNTAKTVFSGTGTSLGILGVSNGTGSIELATDLILNGATLINGSGGTINATGGAKLKINTAGGDIGTTGILTINADLANGTASNIDFWNSGGGTVILRGANTWTGATNIQGATVDVVSLNSVVGGTASSSLGAPVTVAAGTIGMGFSSTSVALKYSGTGETTDRVVNLTGTTGGVTIEHAGTGLLKFTSNFTATAPGKRRSPCRVPPQVSERLQVRLWTTAPSTKPT
ncbi:beta strand repeat-containing protein [Verrucomicrobium spinosum]|uniref:beta strand repeat-containing protein n=1 Tax=Verrucomicrobium spinosum TaxID=2736 RepID=UPI00210E797D|nr:autotransporter-associated beta strand repeat-containing protein [Verrucomicrobium spinosum]